MRVVDEPSPREAIEVDDAATWPARLRAEVAAWSKDVPAGTYAADLRIGVGNEEFVDLLDGRPLRAHHATRLLPHEVAAVRRDGLRALDVQLVEHRIEQARDVGALTPEDAEHLIANHVHARSTAEGRTGQVCLTVGREAIFRDEPAAVELLLSQWGGEAIYWHAWGDHAPLRWRMIGTPTIVVVDVDLDGTAFNSWPGLSSVFIGHQLRLEARACDLLVRGSIPPNAVRACWQPGTPEYDTYRHIPKR